MPLPQGRHGERHDIEPVIKVFTEPPLPDFPIHIAVRGRKDADIDLDRTAASQRFAFLLLKHPEELDLDCRGGFGDFVQEDRSGVGQLKPPFLFLEGPREGAPFVSEELAFQQGFGQGRTVDLDKRPVLPAAVLVEGVGDQLFSRAAFTGNQHRGVRRRHQGYGVEEPLHGRAFAHDICKVEAGFDTFAEEVVLLFQLPEAHGFFHQDLEFVDVEGFGQVIEGAGLEGVHGRVHRRVGRHDDDGDVRADLADAVQGRDAVHPAHADIHED